MLTPTDLFMDGIYLLVHGQDVDNKDLVSAVIAQYEEDVKTNPTQDHELCKAFTTMIRDLIKIPDTDKNEKTAKLLKFAVKSKLKDDPQINLLMTQLFGDTSEVCPEKLQTIKDRLKTSLQWNECNKFIRQMYGKLAKCTSTGDEDQQRMYISDILNLGRQMIDSNVTKYGVSTTAVERIDLSDKKSIQKGFKNYKVREVENVLKTGLQGLDEATGVGGITLGETWVFAALPHQFKSGMLMTLAKGIVQYNTPNPSLGPGIPTILFISLENEANRNMMWWFRTAYETTFMKSSAGLEDEEIINYIHQFYNQNGYRLIVERRLGENFGYEEYVQLVESYKLQGFRIVVTLVDYMNLMKRTSTNKGSRDDLLLKTLYVNMSSYSSANGISLISAHALNREAYNIAKSGKTNVVKYFHGGLMADGMDVERSIDVLVYMYLETNQYGTKFLTCYKPKHRYRDNLPEKIKYFAYPFTQYGIISDINGPPGFTRDIYSEEAPDEADDSKDSSLKMQEMF